MQLHEFNFQSVRRSAFFYLCKQVWPARLIITHTDENVFVLSLRCKRRCNSLVRHGTTTGPSKSVPVRADCKSAYASLRLLETGISQSNEAELSLLVPMHSTVYTLYRAVHKKSVTFNFGKATLESLYFYWLVCL